MNEKATDGLTRWERKRLRDIQRKRMLRDQYSLAREHREQAAARRIVPDVCHGAAIRLLAGGQY